MWTPGDLAILVPMLGRAHTIAPLVKSITATTPGAAVVFICTTGDREVIATAGATGATVLKTAPRVRGDYAAKINHGYRCTTQRLLFTGACDLKFHPGWFDAAVAKLGDGIGVVGTNDLGNRRVTAGKHATHSLVTRAYADEFGTIDHPGQILHEGYAHEYCDDELVGTAKHRKAFAMALDAHVEHLHPDWGKADYDAMYRGQAGRLRASRTLYLKRRRLWT